MSKIKYIFEINILLILFSCSFVNSFVFPYKEIENAINENFISHAYNLTSASQLKSFINQKKH